jgi:hypothetical protein
MPRAKGTNLDNLRAYVLDRHGVDAYELVLRALSPQDQQVMRSLVAVGWYDFELESRLLRTIDGVLGKADLTLIDTIAAYVVNRDVTGVHRLFMRAANPGYLLVRCGDYWSRFYDTGKWRILRHSRTSATGILCGLDISDEAFCVFLRGYIFRLFELSGAKTPLLEHPKCRAKGALECEYTGSWS